MGKIYLTNNQKFEDVENLEVFKIEFLPSKIDLQEYDALIFTSKNAIYSIDSFNKDWRGIDSYCIAKKTAKEVEKKEGKVFFTGNSSNGDDFSKELLPLLKNKKVLYIRAQKVVSNLVNILKSNMINIEELITYKTICNNVKKNIEKNSIIIFTSPSSIEYFLKQFTWHKSFKAIVIGKTTAKYLPKDIEYKISAKTSIEECIKLAKQLNFNV